MLRTPSVTDGTGGARSEKQAAERGQMVKTADQVAQLAFENGLKVSPAVEASLMPTPKARDSQAEGYEAGMRRATPQVRTIVKALVEGDGRLLPTPTLGHLRNHDEPVDDYLERRGKADSGEYKGMPGISLGVAVRMEVLPTPVASEGTKAPAQQTIDEKSQTGQIWLSNAAKAMETNWGKFEPAIRRWEQLTRPAPAPTLPDGKDGAHRLSSKFTEWMMGCLMVG